MFLRFILFTFSLSYVTSCLSIIFGGDTIYIAVNGNDQGTGKINAPYKTMAKGLSSALPGDIIFLKNGLYRERVAFSKSGEKDKPIVPTALLKMTL